MSTLTTSPEPCRGRRARRRHDTAGGPGADGGQRPRLRGPGGGDPARARGEEELLGEPGLGQAGLQAFQVADDGRPHEGVDDGRGGPLELGRLGPHLVRERHELDVGILLQDELPRPQLVGRVEVAVQEAHRDRRHAEGPQPRRRPADARLVELDVHRPLAGEPLGDLEAHPAPRDGLGCRVAGVPDVLLEAPAHLDLVAESLRDQEAGRGPRHLDHRVVRRRGAVHDRRGVTQQRRHVGQRLGLGEAGDPGQHAVGLVLRGGRRLLQEDRAVGTEQHAVGEGPTHVDTDPVAGPRRRSCRGLRSRPARPGPAGWRRGRRRGPSPRASR